MTQLLNPTVGEVVDRMTVLNLKMEATLGKGGGYEKFKTERESLVEYLLTKKGLDIVNGMDGLGNPLSACLQLVNTAIWAAEDIIRRPHYNDLGLGQKISFLNDWRMELVGLINKHYEKEDQSHVAQKIYKAE